MVTTRSSAATWDARKTPATLPPRFGRAAILYVTVHRFLTCGDLNSVLQASTEATSSNVSSDLDRFEVQIGKDTLVYVVQQLDTVSVNSRAEHPENEHEHQGPVSDIDGPTYEVTFSN